MITINFNIMVCRDTWNHSSQIKGECSAKLIYTRYHWHKTHVIVPFHKMKK